MDQPDLAIAGPITGIVLCGGGSRRFRGKDKPLETLDGQPLVAHVINRISPQVDDLIISANRNQNLYGRSGYPVVADTTADRGPLGGIEAALASVSSKWIFVCPGDAPLLPLDLVSRLRAADRDGAQVIVPHDGERAQYLFMLLQVSEAETISAYLDGGGRSVAGWLAGRTVHECPVLVPDAFTNVNTEAELAALAARWHATAE